EHGPVCDLRPVRADELDDLVWAHVTGLLADPALIACPPAESGEPPPGGESRRAPLRHRLRARAAGGRLRSGGTDDAVAAAGARARHRRRVPQRLRPLL